MNDGFSESSQERRTRYMRLAREAKELAAKSKTLSMREACLAMAQSWLTLASEIAPGAEAAAAERPSRSKDQGATSLSAED